MCLYNIDLCKTHHQTPSPSADWYSNRINTICVCAHFCLCDLGLCAISLYTANTVMMTISHNHEPIYIYISATCNSLYSLYSTRSNRPTNGNCFCNADDDRSCDHLAWQIVVCLSNSNHPVVVLVVAAKCDKGSTNSICIALFRVQFSRSHAIARNVRFVH